MPHSVKDLSDYRLERAKEDAVDQYEKALEFIASVECYLSMK